MSFRIYRTCTPELVFPSYKKNSGRSESLRTAACLITVVGVSKGMLPVK